MCKEEKIGNFVCELVPLSRNKTIISQLLYNETSLIVKNGFRCGRQGVRLMVIFFPGLSVNVLFFQFTLNLHKQTKNKFLQSYCVDNE